ncbi:MAG: nicotinate-nucleotide adenylyltransferase [Candidatus Limnocylindrales bacterium]
MGLTGRLALLGGTFDPVHYGHLAIGEAAHDELGLDGVLFLPAGMPPHKHDRTISPPSVRVAMLELAIADNPTFRMCRIEIDRPGHSYTVETLEALVGEGLDEPPHLVVSSEALADFPRWRQPERILALCRLAVVPRPGHRMPGRAWLAEHFPEQEDRVVFLDGPHLGHSASAIRRKVSEGRSIRYLVPPAVETYIHEHGLYPSEVWTKN